MSEDEAMLVAQVLQAAIVLVRGETFVDVGLVWNALEERDFSAGNDKELWKRIKAVFEDHTGKEIRPPPAEAEDTGEGIMYHLTYDQASALYGLVAATHPQFMGLNQSQSLYDYLDNILRDSPDLNKELQRRNRGLMTIGHERAREDEEYLYPPVVKE